MLTDADVSKLDTDLADFLTDGHFAYDGDFPVIVSAASDRLEEVASIVASRGRIRHQLPALGMVSAWLTLGDVVELSKMAAVGALELAQPMQIAVTHN